MQTNHQNQGSGIAYGVVVDKGDKLSLRESERITAGSSTAKQIGASMTSGPGQL